jgi:hypothetical protein
MGSLNLKSLQEPYLHLPWVCFPSPLGEECCAHTQHCKLLMAVCVGLGVVRNRKDASWRGARCSAALQYAIPARAGVSERRFGEFRRWTMPDVT